MRKKSTFLAACFAMAALGATAQFQPVAVTGFNADIIVNGVGPATGSVTPGTNADNGTFAFVSKDFQATASSSIPTYGLPVNGTINSVATSGVTYQLASYSSNNALRLITTAPTGTLSLVTPMPATALYILAYSGNGPAATSYTINFSDGTTQTGTLSINDWYSTAATYAIQGIGRVSVSGDNALEGTSSYPRLFEFKVTMTAANAGKQIANVAFNKTATGTTIVGVMGMAIFYDTNLYTPVTVTGFNADVVANGTGAPTTSTDNDVDGSVAPNPAFAFISPDYKYNATCSNPTYSLPANGAITSISGTNTNLGFQLANYSGPNDLRLTGTNAGTLTFSTPTTANTVFLLGVGGNGSARVNAVVNFTDGTSQTFNNLDINDWYNTTGIITTTGIGRVSKSITACGIDGTSTSPKLFQIPMTLSTTNISKMIGSVTITRVNGVTGFAGIANIMAISVGNTNPSLPITLKTFNGYRNTEGKLLQWTTASEQNNAGFDIERSADGTKFSKIAFVASKAVNGNSSTETSYSLTDATDIKAAAYYRLKQMDKDGHPSYSRIVFIKALNVNSLNVSAIYPNPVKGSLQVRITASKTEKLTLIIVDATGKTVLQKAAQVAEGSNQINMNVNAISSGNYFIKVVGENGEVGVSKFIKN